MLPLAAAGVSEGRDPAAELMVDDPREQQAKQQIEQVGTNARDVTCKAARSCEGAAVSFSCTEPSARSAGAESPVQFCPCLLQLSYRNPVHACQQEKASYKAAFSQLRGLKGEVEHLQLLLEQSRKKLQQDFQQWLGMVARQQQTTQAGQTSSGRDDGASSTARSSRPGTATRQFSRSSSEQGDSLLQRPGSSNRGAVLRKAVSTVSSTSTIINTLTTAAAAAVMTRPPGLDLTAVDPKLLQAAAPHLTGNPEADADIIKFFEAKEKLLQMKLLQGAASRKEAGCF